jgi:hypothetical protein
LTDSRGKNTQLPLADLLRQSVYSRLAGYEDVADLEVSLDNADAVIEGFGIPGEAKLTPSVVRGSTQH